LKNYIISIIWCLLWWYCSSRTSAPWASYKLQSVS